MTSALEATIRAHWVNAWLLYALGRPVVAIDGQEHRARWRRRRPTLTPVPPGKHSVAIGFRYRGTPWLLGARVRSYVVADGTTLRLSAKNGPLNSEPFYVEISSAG